MGFTYPPIIGDSTLYNPRFYPSLGADGALTYDFAQTLYLNKNDFRLSYLSGVIPGSATSGSALVLDETLSLNGLGSVSCTTLTVGGVPVGTLPSFIDGISPGTAANSKALVLGASGEIATIASLTATSIYGTLQTGAQGNITSLGTLSALTIGGNLTFTGASRSITGLSSISATTITGALSGAQTGITSVGTLTNLTLSTGGTGLHIPNLKFYNFTTLTYDQFINSYYMGVSEGGCVAQKALIVDINKDIGSIRNLNAANLNGSTKVSGTLGDFGSINIDGTAIITNGRHIQNIGDIACSGTMNAFDGYQVNSVNFVDASRNISAQAITCADVIIQAPLGNILTTTSAASAYDLQFQNASNTLGATCGIAFTIHEVAGVSTTTPTASIMAVSPAAGTATNHQASDIRFYTRQSQIQSNGAMKERMRIHANGNFSFGDTGDQRINFLHDLNSVSMRFGTRLAVKDCYTMTWNYAGTTGSDASYLSFNTYGTSNTLVLTATDRVGIGTSTPACGLDVVKFETVSMTGPLATGTSSAYTVNRSGTFSDSVSIYCRQALMVGTRGIYVGSDRRVKENIDTIPPEDGVKFVRDINPKIYTLKGFDKRQIGYISQDMMQDYSALLSLLPDPNMTIEQEGDVDGAFVSLSYERVPAFLHAALKSVLDRLDEIEAKIATLT